MVAVVHQALARRDLLPGDHLVDKGYTDSRMLVEAPPRYGVTIVGPVAADTGWQARVEGGLEQEVMTCPAGKRSISWLPNTWPKNGMMFEARFARRDCTPCALRPLCTRANHEPRIIGLQAREHFEALQSARRHQKTEAFRASYAARAGIEGTHAQAIRRCGLRQCRYLGRAKTQLQHVIRAAAVNLVRLAGWFAGTPVAKTRWLAFRHTPVGSMTETGISPPVSLLGMGRVRALVSRTGERQSSRRRSGSSRMRTPHFLMVVELINHADVERWLKARAC